MRLRKLIDTEKCEYNWKKIEKIKEFDALKHAEQNPRWHKEGNAWNHTKMVCEEAIKVAKNEYEGEDRLVFLAAALFHDIGKGTTTKMHKDGNWHSYGHEFEGEKMTRLILWGEDTWTRERICALVRYHMEIEFIQDSEKFLPKLVSMSKAVGNLDMLIKLKECDLRGSIQYDEDLKEIELLKLDETRETARSLGFLYHMSSVPEFYKFAWQKTLKAKNSGNPITVVVPIGLSGAGKSTWVKENYPDAVVVMLFVRNLAMLSLVGRLFYPDRKKIGFQPSSIRGLLTLLVMVANQSCLTTSTLRRSIVTDTRNSCRSMR